jgi:hypothetical protein
MRQLMTRAIPAAAIAALLTISACGDTTGPPENLAVTLDFGVALPTFVPTFATSRSDGQLIVHGTIVTPCAPTSSSAAVQRESHALVLLVTVDSAAECDSSPITTRYTATITGIGRLRAFEVVHVQAQNEVVVYQTTFN